jgi:hypothetical protein
MKRKEAGYLSSSIDMYRIEFDNNVMLIRTCFIVLAFQSTHERALSLDNTESLWFE